MGHGQYGRTTFPRGLRVSFDQAYSASARIFLQAKIVAVGFLQLRFLANCRHALQRNVMRQYLSG